MKSAARALAVLIAAAYAAGWALGRWVYRLNDQLAAAWVAISIRGEGAAAPAPQRSPGGSPPVAPPASPAAAAGGPIADQAPPAAAPASPAAAPADRVSPAPVFAAAAPAAAAAQRPERDRLRPVGFAPAAAPSARALQAQGLSQRQIAAQLGVSRWKVRQQLAAA